MATSVESMCWRDFAEGNLSTALLHLKCSTIGIGFDGAETNCGIARILGILLMNGLLGYGNKVSTGAAHQIVV